MLYTYLQQIIDNLPYIVYEDAAWISLRQLGQAYAFGDKGSKLLERLRAKDPILTKTLIRFFSEFDIRKLNPYFPLPSRSPGGFFIRAADIPLIVPHLPRFSQTPETSLGDQNLQQGETSGYLFFLFAPEVNRIRVGFSLHPYQDIDLIKSQSPCRLHRFKEVRGSERIMYALKSKFKKLKFNNDWFNLTPELSSFIREL